jgi:glucan phosphorylase
MVDQRIASYANELDSRSNKTIEEKRRLVQQYQNEMSDIYQNIQNRKDTSKELAKIEMLEKGAERIKANEAVQRQLEELEAFKREEQVKYRHLLDVQVPRC